MKKTAACLLALLLALLPLAACGKDDGEGKDFRFPIAAMPVNLDPAIANSREETLILANCFEGLIRLRGSVASNAQTKDDDDAVAVDTSGAFVPGVAERWEVSDDGLRYTFYLRQDTHWRLHKDAKTILGEDEAEAFDTTVTAADFLFAFRRALAPETGAPNAALLFPIKNAAAVHAGSKAPEELGVSVIDRFTLEITLEQANASFLYALCQSVAMPCSEEYFNATKGRYGLNARHLCSNGPFYLYSWENALLRLRVNDGYQGDAPVAPYSVTFKAEQNNAERLRLLGLEGGYSAVLIPADTPIAEETGANALRMGNATLTLLFRSGSGAPLADGRLRRALCMAIDAAALGYTQPQGLLPSGLRLGGETYRTLAGPARRYVQDIAGAKKLWDESIAEREAKGITEPLALSVLCPGDANTQIRQMLQQWQSAFGLRLQVNIESPEPEELAARIARGEYDIALTTLESGDSFALNVLEQWTDAGSGNLTGYRAQAVDSMLNEAAQLPAQEAAQQLLAAEEHLLQAGVYYPLEARESVLLLAKGVSGLEVSAAGDIVWFGGGRIVE